MSSQGYNSFSNFSSRSLGMVSFFKSSSPISSSVLKIYKLRTYMYVKLLFSSYLSYSFVFTVLKYLQHFHKLVGKRDLHYLLTPICVILAIFHRFRFCVASLSRLLLHIIDRVILKAFFVNPDHFLFLYLSQGTENIY